eukprot:TRINITY_DN240_c7_g1_i1.p1 TRINITY_DN240_c7_g1~~TRINITY_DN240_c7_g1_i1.p1  ORF type:complete len:622 (+),score=125.41 TRINITY_DN240_c7_g1_i1:62-1927(+)
MSIKYALGEDLHSWSNFKQVITTDLDLSVRVDFQRQILFGNVVHTLSVLEDGVTEVNFDTRALGIEDILLVSNEGEESVLAWTIPKSHPALGKSLTVTLPQTKKGDQLKVKVVYSTTRKSGAIQWFEPQQTAGGKHPYMYTQCQAILARTLLPCMDSPSVKATYTLNVSVPNGLVAVCSGTRTGSKDEVDGYQTHTYRQVIPTPSYLIALAAGKLETQAIGPRSAVWTEAELLKASVHEFEEHTESFIKAAESIFDNLPYEWGTYDLLILPTAFPYGGMENPQLTFVNSSLLVGDRSLVDVVAHEICHSWSGNLVTNSTWTDFWLNEGFTMYLERQLLSKVIGGEDYRKFHIFLGYKELIRTSQDLIDVGEGEFTKLQPDLRGVDPDDAFSIIPYEKGCLFLFYLELKVGGHENFLKWVSSMYHKYKRSNFNTAQMKADFLEYFNGKVDKQTLDSIEWDHWLHDEGMPRFDPSKDLTNKFSQECNELTEKWIKSDGSDFSAKDIENFKPSQVMFCLDELVTSSAMPLSKEKIAKLESAYNFSKSKNVEISNRMIVLCLKSKFLDAEVVDKFLGEHGRMRYIKPVFLFLDKVDHNKAVELWKKHRTRYHTVLRNIFDPKLSK